MKHSGCQTGDTVCHMNSWFYVARAQIFLDYLSLALLLYFVGALHTELFNLFLFHILLGVTILPLIEIIFLAIITCIGKLTVGLLTISGLLTNYDFLSLSETLTIKRLLFDTSISFVLFIVCTYVAGVLSRSRHERGVDLVKSNQKIQQALDDLTEVEKRKSNFMLFSAHQLRSPLGTIIAALNILTTNMVALDSPRAMKLMSGALDKARALLDIVNDLLELAKLHDLKEKRERNKTVNLTQILEEIIFTLQPIIEKKSERFIRNYLDQHVTESYSDKEELSDKLKRLPAITIHTWEDQSLWNAFLNLIQNAVKYTPSGKEIELTVTSENRYTVITIKDEGIGIPRDQLQEIFKEFVRAPNAKLFENEGTGIGLSIANEVIVGHSGTISVDSTIDLGSTFTVKIPHQ